MKRIYKLLTVCLICVLNACEKNHDTLPNGIENEKLSASETMAMIDPATPRNVQPTIVQDGLKSAPSADWVLVFSDEFDWFNSAKWNKTVSDKSRSPRWDKGIADWWYVADHVDIQNGKLRLKASKPDHNTMYCGSVDSKDLFEPQYGYLEARMQIAPISEAVHSAFWLQGQNQGNIDSSGADGCEVDIFESPYAADKVQTALHWDGYNIDTKGGWTQQWSSPGVHSGYHIFGLNWTPNSLEVYYDGVKKLTYTGVGVPKVREFLWLSVGASFKDGDFINGTYPVYAYVDYVHVYKKPSVIEVECENQSYYSPSNDNTDVKTNTLASQNKHVRLLANSTNDRIRFDSVYVEVSGNYSVSLTGLTWSSFGAYSCSVHTQGAWHYFTPTIDFYNSNSIPKEVTFGTVFFDEGYHSITFTAKDKNPNSNGYTGSFDKIVLTPQ